MSESQVMHRVNKCTVWVRLDEEGNLIFEGQDLSVPGLAEYEYDVIVPAADVPTVIRALGGTPDSNVLELCVKHGEMIFLQGEYSWVESLGIEAGLWSRQEPE